MTATTIPTDEACEEARYLAHLRQLNEHQQRAQPLGVQVRAAGKAGRGVYALRSFEPGEIIEAAPFLDITIAEADGPVLEHYCFASGKKGEQGNVLVLGYGSLYNHQYGASADFTIDDNLKVMVIRAARRINEGEQITINYNGEPEDETPGWEFDGSEQAERRMVVAREYGQV